MVLILLLDYINKKETMYFIIHNWNLTIICKYLYCLKKEGFEDLINTWYSEITGLRNGKLGHSIYEVFFNIENVVSNCKGRMKSVGNFFA